MSIFAGLDVSDKTTHVCVVGGDGAIVWRGVCATDPEVIAKTLGRHAAGLGRVVLETGPLSAFLYHGLVARAALVGKWRIVESGTWPRGHLDLCGPAFLCIDADGTGEMAFGALTASVDGGFTPSGIDFDWNGADEGDQVTGTGWADLRNDGRLEGGFAYDNGDETTFIAQPWPFSATC